MKEKHNWRARAIMANLYSMVKKLEAVGLQRSELMPVRVQWAIWKDWGETGAKGWAEALPPKESKTRNYSTLIIISSVRIWVLAVKINRKNSKSQSKMHSWMKQHEIHHILKYSLLVNKGFVLLVYDTISKVSVCWSFRSKKVNFFFVLFNFCHLNPL